MVKIAVEISSTVKEILLYFCWKQNPVSFLMLEEMGFFVGITVGTKFFFFFFYVKILLL